MLDLHFHEFVNRKRLRIGQVYEEGLGDDFQVLLNSVLDDVVDGDDQLLELVQALMHVLQIRVDVHGGPSEGHHTGPQFEL